MSHHFRLRGWAGHIVVLAGGRVVEPGNHATLMEQRGLYRELYEIQARAYG